MHFETYLRSFAKHPRLSADEERLLFDRAQSGDKRAKEEFFRRSMWVAASCACSYGARRKVPLDEAFSECCHGMTVAFTKFDPNRARFSTYAVQWMHCFLRRYVPSGVALDHPQSAKFSSFRRAYARASNKHDVGHDRLVEIAASEVGARPESAAMWGDLLGSKTTSMDASHCDAETGTEHTLHDLLRGAGDPESVLVEVIESDRRRRSVDRALRSLSARDREILRRNVMREDEEPLRDVGRDFGITGERVRQLRNKALGAVGEVLKKKTA